ncbi:MAG TPA: vitamin K epoxide reductase family protein [Candidatus Angelobacter sp.]|nr:vitamin K epoxide reductase family protein [Candidatus Angelobacter sp.]
MMRWSIVTVALLGVIVASLALHEHYNTGISPCSINDKWDCGIVNHSPYAIFGGIPVAVIGIVGYVVLGALAWKRAWLILFPTAVVGLAFSLYLTHIEASVLEVWCIYCVISLTVISVLTALALGIFVWRLIERPNRRRAASGN